MRQFCLQKEFYQLKKQAPIQVSAVAKVREHQLTVWETLQKQGVNAEAASQVMRKSRATLYRRKKRFREKGWAGLEPVSRRPKQLRKRRLREEIIEEVQSLRRLYPCWGKEKIRVLMASDGIEVSASTVGRIIQYLKERKAIPEVPYHKRWKGKWQPKRPYATIFVAIFSSPIPEYSSYFC